METPVAEMKYAYQSTLAMLESVLGTCTEEIGEKEFSGASFWREAYHAIFWMHNYLGPRDKAFEFQPFGVDIDPRLLTPPNNTCTLVEVRGYAAEMRATIDEVFDAMTFEGKRFKEDEEAQVARLDRSLDRFGAYLREEHGADQPDGEFFFVCAPGQKTRGRCCLLRDCRSWLSNSLTGEVKDDSGRYRNAGGVWP